MGAAGLLLLLLPGRCAGLRITHWPLQPRGSPPRAMARMQGRTPAGGEGLADPIGFAVGIDLGTTTSAIAVVVDGRPQVIHTLRSVVRPAGVAFATCACEDSAAAVPWTADVRTGADARAAERVEVVGTCSPEEPGVLFSAKRLMGRTYEEADATLPRHSALRRLLAPLPPENSNVDVANSIIDAGNSSDAADPPTLASAQGRAAGGGKARAGLRPSSMPRAAPTLRPPPVSSSTPVSSSDSVASPTTPVSSPILIPPPIPILSPEWVSSRVLLALLNASEAATGVRARRAVIGVPAHFGEKQREATRAAAAMAGIDTVKLVVEPVAAALAYDVAADAPRGAVLGYTPGGAGVLRLPGGAGQRGKAGRGAAGFSILGTRGDARGGPDMATRGGGAQGGSGKGGRRAAAAAAAAVATASRGSPPVKDRNEIVCVFDLGGGTLDVSILSMGGGTAEVLSSSGDAWLGGDDFDAAIAAALARRAEIPAGAAAEAGLVAAAREAKERLTVNPAVNVSVCVPARQGAPAIPPVEVLFSRADMHRACAPLLARLCAPLIKAAAACQIPLREPRGGLGEWAGGGGEGKGGDGEGDGARDVHGSRGSGGNSPSSPPHRSRADAARPSLRGRRIDRVLLVGAASRMPAVASIVQEYIGLRPDQNSVRPEDAVACGAAVQAAILQGELQAYDVFTVLEAALIRGVMREQGSQRERKRRAGNGGERARRR